MRLDVFLLPELATDRELAGRTVIVIDILRATTTMTQALSAGATRVLPCLEVSDARRLAAGIPGAVLGGERGGRRIEGFALGNSPAEYTPDSVGNRTVIFTTTNGTRALERCRGAARVLLGSFNNLSALIASLGDVPELALVCSGTDGKATEEDRLFAGAVVQYLTDQHSGDPAINDEAYLAARLWRAVAGQGQQQLEAFLLGSRGGRNLTELGMARDVLWAARIDTVGLIAELQLDRWQCVPRR